MEFIADLFDLFGGEVVKLVDLEHHPDGSGVGGQDRLDPFAQRPWAVLGAWLAGACGRHGAEVDREAGGDLPRLDVGPPQPVDQPLGEGPGVGTGGVGDDPAVLQADVVGDVERDGLTDAAVAEQQRSAGPVRGDVRVEGLRPAAQQLTASCGDERVRPERRPEWVLHPTKYNEKSNRI
ncbi:MAG: hypothetical protein QM733_18605 [Ilumatobacteraceae bacterium]